MAVFSFRHSLKSEVPILVTPGGIVAAVNFPHDLNALLPMLVKLFGKEMLVKLMQL